MAVLDAQTAAPDVSDVQVRQLQVLSDLHDRGTLSDAQFAAERARIMGQPTSPPAEQSGPLGSATGSGSPHR
jgi:hypothetical protein